MEADAAAEDGRDGPRERLGLGEAGRQQQNHEVRSQSRADQFPKHSYWLDLWLFILFDVVLFIFVYLLPW
uniref:Chromosome 4 open reading frame 3 n=3 Tax=Ursus TaxID=9639 RepID=A0A452T8W2_URSMA